MLLVVYGLPFTGKRRFGRLLASHLSCKFISTSEIRNRWIAAPTFRLSEKRAVYLNLLQESAEALADGKCLVLAGTFYRAEFREDLETLASTFNEHVLWIQLPSGNLSGSFFTSELYDVSYARKIRNKINERFQPMTTEQVISLENLDTIERALSRIDKIITNDLSGQVDI